MIVSVGAKKALRLLARGSVSELRERLKVRLQTGPYSKRVSLGLRRDLEAPFAAPKAKIPITVRELQDADVPIVFPEAPTAENRQDAGETAWRRKVVGLAIPRCFVAVDERTQTPCYAQWLIGPDQNERVAEIGCFPWLQPDEALLENAYTPAPYRGLGIMSAAMALIAERARDHGLRYAITFVAHDNVASLKGCERAGFSPYLMHQQTQYAFNSVRSTTFVQLPDGNRQTRAERSA